MKYFLIHGYGLALSVTEKSIPKNGGFYSFDEEIGINEAYAYVWAKEVKRGRFTPFNLWKQLKLYYEERKISESETESDRLRLSLIKTSPQVIVAHSSGARLVLSYLRKHSLPASVEGLVFVQADISPREWGDVRLPSSIKFLNFWCWWDQSLLVSMILNRYIPLGLFSKTKFSRFYPFNQLPNPHQDICKDMKFKKILLLEFNS